MTLFKILQTQFETGPQGASPECMGLRLQRVNINLANIVSQREGGGKPKREMRLCPRNDHEKITEIKNVAGGSRSKFSHIETRYGEGGGKWKTQGRMEGNRTNKTTVGPELSCGGWCTSGLEDEKYDVLCTQLHQELEHHIRGKRFRECRGGWKNPGVQSSCRANEKAQRRTAHSFPPQELRDQAGARGKKGSRLASRARLTYTYLIQNETKRKGSIFHTQPIGKRSSTTEICAPPTSGGDPCSGF